MSQFQGEGLTDKSPFDFRWVGKTNLGVLEVLAASDAAALRDQERELDGEVVEHDYGEAL